VIDSGDDDLFAIRTFQLDAFDRLQVAPSKYISRIVENVSFIPTGGQRWEREIQVNIPTLPDIPPHQVFRSQPSDFIVSLGTFRRRRFADLKVTTDNGLSCRLLTRRQHGYCLATCLLLQLLNTSEWSDLDSTALHDLHSHLAAMITTVPRNDAYTSERAQGLLVSLFDKSGITDPSRLSAASEILASRCESIAEQTQYLCWVTAKPGESVQIFATYTQADSPRPYFEPEPQEDAVTDSVLRLKWRNRRTRLYARYNLFPLRYAFNAPSYGSCQSYYFTITPPPETRISLLDWGNGSRFRTAVADSLWRSHNVKCENLRPPDGTAEELDCSRFSYHFHNRRLVKDRRSQVRSGQAKQDNDKRSPGGDRRSRLLLDPARINVFVRPEPIDNGKLAAIGLLGVALAVLAERGALVGSGINQWLLLAPAALVLYVGQQRQHYYARFTKRYRLSIWAYVALSMMFAGSIAFDSPSIPLIPAGISGYEPRAISALFGCASVALAFASMWSGKYFEVTTGNRYRRIIQRVCRYDDPSLLKAWRKRQNRPVRDFPDPMGEHPSDKIYAATARHGIDRLLFSTAGILALALCAMTLHWPWNWQWGASEGCKLKAQTLTQKAQERGESRTGHCVNDRLVVATIAPTAHAEVAHGAAVKGP
jgi:hypothetical protein